MRVLVFIILLSISLSCERKSDNKIVAIVDDNPISLSSIDSVINDKLYSRLYEIYAIRKIALDIVIEEQLFSLEAINRNISVDSLFSIEVFNKLTNSSMEEFVANSGLQKGVPDARHPGRLLDPNSTEGKEYLSEVFFRKTKSDFAKSLRKKYNVKTYLKPPLTRKLKLENVYSYSLNSSASPITILIASDFECQSCQANHKMLSELMIKYKDQVSFRFTPLSDTTNYSMLFFDCISDDSNSASVYKSMFETFSESKIDYTNISRAFGTDIKEINDCIQSDTLAVEKINQSIEILKGSGILQTPTLIVDGRIYYGEFSVQSISEYIDSIIDQ